VKVKSAPEDDTVHSRPSWVHADGPLQAPAFNPAHAADPSGAGDASHIPPSGIPASGGPALSGDASRRGVESGEASTWWPKVVVVPPQEKSTIEEAKEVRRVVERLMMPP
jgi:hypothetical protein